MKHTTHERQIITGEHFDKHMRNCTKHEAKSTTIGVDTVDDSDLKTYKVSASSMHIRE